MDKTYNIVEQEGITIIRFTKSPTFTDVIEMIDDIVENHAYKLRLYDLSKIKFDLPSKELRKIAEYGQIKFTQKNRLAFVAPDDLAFGEMRMFSAFREQEIAEVSAFRTEKEAIKWLLSDSTF